MEFTNDSFEINFSTALKYAIEKGHIKFDLTNFEGWLEDCNCARCRSQRIVAGYLFDNHPPANAAGE